MKSRPSKAQRQAAGAPSRGLGDTIAKITHATHLAALTELYSDFTGKSCQCEKRRRALNKWVPYRKQRRAN